MTATPAPATDGSGRIEWLELFFDLGVVAAVALLAHSIRDEPTGFGVGLFVVMYAAIWMTWVNVVLYTDVAREQTRIRTVLAIMLCIGVMAGSNPLHFEARANLFAAGFIAARVFVLTQATRTGRMLASWPLLQHGGFLVLWVVSLFVPEPAKFVLWAVAVAVDLVLVVRRDEASGSAELDEYRQRYRSRIDQAKRRRRGNPGRRVHADEKLAAMPDLVEVDVDRRHLDERLGLLVIVMLGEAAMQLVGALGADAWTRERISVCLAGFVLIVGLWLLTFAFGFSASPQARLATLPPRFGLPLHLASTLGILVVAAGVGELAEHPDQSLATAILWLTCGGLALHFAVGLTSGLAAGAPLSWVLGVALPSVLIPLATGVTGTFFRDFPPARFAWLLVLPVAWQWFYSARHARERPLG